MIGQRPFEHFRPSSFLGLFGTFSFYFSTFVPFFIPGRVYQAILRQVKSQIKNLRSSRNMKVA